MTEVDVRIPRNANGSAVKPTTLTQKDSAKMQDSRKNGRTIPRTENKSAAPIDRGVETEYKRITERY